MPGDRRGTARRGALYGVAGLVAAGAVWYFAAAPRAPAQVATPASDVVAAASAPPAAAVGASGAGALPASLAGSSAPRLPLDAQGHLAKSRAVRDFFDYCLAAQSDLTAAELDALVKREIAAQLDGSPAQQEALDVWQRYGRYLAELARLPDGGGVPDKLDTGAMRLALDARASLASRTLGDWSEPFFGAEQQQQRHDLARLKIAQDPNLTPAQKTARLAALDQELSPAQRAEQARIKQQQDAIGQIARLQQSGASPDELRAQLAQTLGPAAAERVAQMQRDDDAWQAKYRDYAAARAQLDAQGLSPQDRDAQLAQLRQRYFTEPGEALRAASLDRGGDAGPRAQ
ncbi:lipase secretion chaperone [Burkholderia sp. FERM BP-3421]|jgi:lipase chaperone LimK|uniref:lipase secretion chaperone n=1 Tax=Burkholderia sp. FERM BP-3421 TaxID=1494466 RepID=UPI002362E27A|nr:lipase secretion chaperone [Burkholderia sp. FERM BP-3421]WDD92756.1 lipase secretion chaperone [Burkholderia sp. FERM BP-3421]